MIFGQHVWGYFDPEGGAHLWGQVGAGRVRSQGDPAVLTKVPG